MLIATYALSTLSVEQKKERSFIAHMQLYLHAHAAQPQHIDPVCLEAQLNELTAFAEARHQSKVDACLLPAVRAASHDAAPLLADLENLSRAGHDMLRSVRKYLRHALRDGVVQIENLCRTLERYCQNLLERLAKEEHELLPLAQRVISSDNWFAIGAAFLAYDAVQVDEQRRLLIGA